MPVAAVLSAKNCFSLGRAHEGLFEVIETKLEKGRLLDDGGGFFDHFGGRRSDNGDANFADAGPKKLCGCGGSGHVRSHVYNRGILQTRDCRCKFLLKEKDS